MQCIGLLTVHLLGSCLGAVANTLPSPTFLPDSRSSSTTFLPVSRSPTTTTPSSVKRVERSAVVEEEGTYVDYVPNVGTYKSNGRLGSDKGMEAFSVLSGWDGNHDPPLRADQMSWALEPQVGKRPKRLHGEARLVESALEAVGREAASTVLARQQRTGRMYDVPQIG